MDKILPDSMSKLVLKTTILIIVLGTIYTVYTIYSTFHNVSKLKDIQANWSEYKCRPYIIPIAGYIGPAGTTSSSTFAECSSSMFKNYFYIYMQSFIDFCHQVVYVLVDLVSSVQNIRQMFSYMRDSIDTFLLDIANMFYAYATKFSLLFNRLLQTFNKISTIFEDIHYSMAYSSYTIQSILNGPIGSVASFFSGSCFSKDTMITMENGMKKISEIKVGDKIKNGKIIGVHIFSGKNTQMYNYKNIIVSGTHLVCEDGKYIRIEKSNLAIPTKEEDIIYCLTTSTGKIDINEILFADYMEVENSYQFQHIYNIIMQHLNQKVKNQNVIFEKVFGFEKNTLVTLQSGVKKISKLKLNDVLEDNNVVWGITKAYAKKCKLYSYNNIIASSNVIIKTDKWELMKNIGTPLTDKKIVLYHIFTKKGEININNVVCKDYDSFQNKEISENINDKVNTYVENQLNRK